MALLALTLLFARWGTLMTVGVMRAREREMPG